MTAPRWLLATLLALAGSGCVSLSDAQRDSAALIADGARSQLVDCTRDDACAQPSPLRKLGDRALRESTAEQPRHYALILDHGRDALLARIDLIRGARRSIDLQTYIFDTDDSARLVLDELLAAARRGVKVRLLVDQLSAIGDIDILGALASSHRNFSLRIYNPTFGKAKLHYLDYAASVLCCFRRFNQRMHTKLLLVDGEVGISGGRNYQDDYYDWDAEYNFRDRDVLVAGPAAAEMQRNFDAFWEARRSVPAERLNDVGRRLLREGAPQMPAAQFRRPARVEELKREAADTELQRARFADQALPVGAVQYVADLPQKHRRKRPERSAVAAPELRNLIEGAQKEVLLQTPYLVFSKQAQQMFLDLRARPSPPRVVVSTSSLAASDNPIVYSLAFKYKRRYLRDFGFQIFELKPFPEDAPIDYAALLRSEAPPLALEEEAATAAEGKVQRELLRGETRPSFFGSKAANRPIRLKRAGIRIGLHAKSLVVDERVGVIGTDNFDPRSDNYNTEAVVIVEDAGFARALAASIRRDIEPENSWTIGPREKPPLFSGLNYSLDKISSALPLFDLWPWRYSTNYEFVPGPDCPAPLPTNDPNFARCYRDVGDFPEVKIGPKRLYVRILTAFGAGLVPIL
ncbi:phospholipase D family protein [Pseudoxanthomonas helianthi]|uniref:phospholipase D family protein n=1 Tax=Pseudoxanthomonas helianthi TaxID=1453541 RepID=UPI001FD524B0|nr:phospholipase D family protein [Pseudoxanthomonas helianthi]